MEAVRRHPWIVAIAGAIVLWLVFLAFPIVPETRQAVVVRFGKPERILNEYKPGRQIGAVGAGISWRIPFVDQIVWIDKRILDVDMQTQNVLSTDKRWLQVDAYARYRIVNPLLMYVRATTEDNLQAQLKTILGSDVRNELGKQPFAALLSPERQGVMDDIRNELNDDASKYGVEIVDVRIKRTDLPDGAPLQSAYESMSTAREQEARSIRAEGMKQAQIIQAQADADAAKIYADSYGKDPQFYDFYRAMQSYKVTFVGGADGKATAPTTIILSPKDDYLKQFTGEAR
ncbi:MAG TPA: protease modulator HflC [Sphingomicrobium sp.]|nr:protease modulator HflC [Sphingomicrobium sp.]